MERAWCVKNNNGQEVICQCCNKPFDYLDTVLKLESKELLPKGLYSDKTFIEQQNRGGWCNTFSEGYYSVPKLVGVVVPNGTFEKLGINYNGEPVEIK